jgi:MerR family transcriptional regulator, copper efflux regulator
MRPAPLPAPLTATPASPAFPRAVPLTSGAVCAAAQVTRGQLRVYEREGLIPPPRRTGGGFRDYPADTVARLQAIRQLKEVGFTLAEIALLLAEGDAGQLDAARMQALAAQQLDVIDQRIGNLKVVRRFVAAVAGGDMTALNDPDCSFLVQFLASGSRRPRRPQRRQA